MNFFDARREDGVGGQPAPVVFGRHRIPCRLAPSSSPAVTLAIRPEDLSIAADDAEDGDGVSHLDGTVRKISFAGREVQYVVECEDGVLLAVNVARPTLEQLNHAGGKLRVALPHASLLVFDKETRRRL